MYARAHSYLCLYVSMFVSRVSYRIFRLGGGGGDEKEGCVMRKRGVGDKSLCQ